MSHFLPQCWHEEFVIPSSTSCTYKCSVPFSPSLPFGRNWFFKVGVVGFVRFQVLVEFVQDSRDPKGEGWSLSVGFPCASVCHRGLRGYYSDMPEVSKYNSSSNCPGFVLTLEQEILPGICCFPRLTRCRGSGCRAVGARLHCHHLQGLGVNAMQ